MRKLSLCLDCLPALREISGGTHLDLAAATSLAELAGVDAIRLGINEDLRPVAEVDVQWLRRSARLFELRMSVSQSLLKVALETRPDMVLLAGDTFEGTLASRPVELRSQSSALAPIVRSLEEAGIEVAMLVTPALESVKAAHGLGVHRVELFTGATVDLPPVERRGSARGPGRRRAPGRQAAHGGGRGRWSRLPLGLRGAARGALGRSHLRGSGAARARPAGGDGSRRAGLRRAHPVRVPRFGSPAREAAADPSEAP